MNDKSTEIICPTNEMMIYQSEDGSVKVDVFFDKETVWLSVHQMAELFTKDESNIRRHIGNVFAEGELPREGNAYFLHVPFSDKPVPHYSLVV